MTYVDAEGVVKNWVNAQTFDLVGEGHPLPKGALLNRLQGAAPAAYVALSLVGGTPDMGAEDPDHRARISGSVYGRTKEAASTAAVAYANKVAGLALTGSPLVTVQGALVRLLTADSIVGPLWLPDLDEPRYVVDADFYLQLVG